MKKLLIIIILFLSFALGFQISFTSRVEAIGLCVPSGCPTGTDGLPSIEPDFTCVNAKIADPSFDCCENKCKDTDDIAEPSVLDTYRELEVFGAKIKISDDKIPNIISMAFATALAIISVYTMLRGIYVAGVLRPQAITPEDIAKLNKELTNLVLGFVIAWSFIFLIQFVFNVLALGSVWDFDIHRDTSDNVIVIE